MTAVPLRLLLLEDNPGDARLVHEALADDAPGEFTIATVERLAHALARIQAERFDAMLCDLGLPDSTGLGTARAIVAGAPALPLVVLTGSHNEDLGRAAIALGAQDYLVKGETTAPMIARTLRYAIERKRLENELHEANETLERRVAERTAELETANGILRESEQKYRGIYENLQDVYIEADVDGSILEVSPQIEILSRGQYARDDLLGKSTDMFHADPARREAFFLALRERGTVKDFEATFTNRDGSTVVCSISAKIQLGADGKPRRVCATVRDITERKRAELLLQRERDTAHRYLNVAGVIMLALDADGTVALINRKGVDILGYEASDILGQPWIDRFVPEHLRDSVRWVFDQLMSGHKDGVEHVEGAVLCRGGEKRLIAWNNVILTDEQGRSVGTLSSGEDITERKRAEEQLRAAEERFRGLVEQAIAGIYVVQDDKFAYVNPRYAEIFGYGSAEELIGRDPLSVVAEKDRETYAEHMRQRIAGEVASISYQFTGLRKDGSTIEVGMHGARASHNGRPAVIGMMQDISEKKRADEKIERYVAQLEKAFMSTVEVATSLSEMRDPYTAGHEKRVANIAVAIGAELGFDARRQEGLRVAGYLHDIGKITIPSEILSKPGKLSSAEFTLIKGHPQASYDVLKGVDFPWPVAEVALQHHERIDGSGYPRGLEGDAILLEARIMSVADVVEAMASHRPYRPGLGIDKALAEIERGRGTEYDTDVADACLKLFREKGYAVPA